MKNKIKIVVLLIALSLPTILLHAFDVVRDGKAKSYILLSENASKGEKFAAEEFAKYVKKLTNKIEVAYLLFESICLVDTQNGHRS